MKQPIFILSSLMCICAIPTAWASDSLDEEPLVAPVAVVEPVVAEPDNVEFSMGEYARQTMDDIAKTRARVDELLIPQESVQNLWTDDAIISNSASTQSVVLKPLKKQAPGTNIQKMPNAGFSLGDQTYYGETVYIINNFLSGATDNVSTVDGEYNGTKQSWRAEYSNCPFSTPSECEIWRRKPVISETVAPRSKRLRDNVMCEISDAIAQNPNISANEKVMAPLLNRYKVLMRASQSCCTGGITYKLHKAGATQALVYKFLSDDANFSGYSMRCLVMGDDEIMGADEYQATAATVADVRNGCICKSRANFAALLAPFTELYAEYPAFKNASFEYKHYDGVGRATVSSVNADVQNVLHQLEMCP